MTRWGWGWGTGPKRLVAGLVLGVAAAGSTGTAGTLRKPRLDLRATPRVAFSPVDVLLTAELVGGDEIEEFYCPALEWDWGDGGKSVRESDCPPFQPGSELVRRFSAQHGYRQAGEYEMITVTLRRANRSLAVASARVNVKPGLGDFSAY
jgi:hypothetical protein